MLKVYILTGIPASGKSTWANQMQRSDPGHWKVIKMEWKNIFTNLKISKKV